MLFRKQGFPEEGELVICTVTKVQHHSVFVNVEEYQRSGMIHISEVSPGRIRNIRDYVVEGKVIVCQVLRVNQERGYIDLSLRRVSDNRRRKKVDEIKQQQKAERILEFAAKNLKRDIKGIYDDVSGKALKSYPTLYSCFEAVVTEGLDLGGLGISKDIVKELAELIKQRIKPPKVEINGRFLLRTYEPNGLDIVKEALKKALAVDKEKIKILYEGGGRYALTITAEDYKTAEKMLEKATGATVTYMEEHDGTGQFVRDEA